MWVCLAEAASPSEDWQRTTALRVGGELCNG